MGKGDSYHFFVIFSFSFKEDKGTNNHKSTDELSNFSETFSKVVTNESWQLNSIAESKILGKNHDGDDCKDAPPLQRSMLPLAIPNLMPVAFEEVSSHPRPVRQNLCQDFIEGIYFIFK